jgi:hypothetical protein
LNRTSLVVLLVRIWVNPTVAISLATRVSVSLIDLEEALANVLDGE